GRGGVGTFSPEELPEVAALLIRSSCLPTFPQHPNPFECEGPQHGMVFYAFGNHALVIDLGPGREDDGLASPLNKGLAQERGCEPAPMSPDLVPAFFPHWCNPGEFLEACRIGMEAAQGAEGNAQAGCQLGASSGQVTKKIGFGMGGKNRFDFFLHDGQVFAEGP